MSLLMEQLGDEHARLMPHVDELRVIADEAPGAAVESLRARLRAEHAFLVHEFLPHMDAEQATLHRAIEQVLGATRPRMRMTDAHTETRALVDAIGALGDEAGASGIAWLLEARRALYQLYACLKIHLAEEELLTPILVQELTDEQELELAAKLEFGVPPGEA